MGLAEEVRLLGWPDTSVKLQSTGEAPEGEGGCRWVGKGCPPDLPVDVLWPSAELKEDSAYGSQSMEEEEDPGALPARLKPASSVDPPAPSLRSQREQVH